MKLSTRRLILDVILPAILPIAFGFAVGYGIRKYAEYQDKQKTISIIQDYSDRFDNLSKELDLLDVTNEDYDGKISDFILRTFSIYEQSYRLVPEKRLLDKKDKKPFNDVLKLMEEIQTSQRKADRNRQNFLSGLGLAQVFVIEAEQYEILVNDYAIDTMKEVLKIDPNNQQAQKQLEKIYSKNKEFTDAQDENLHKQDTLIGAIVGLISTMQ